MEESHDEAPADPQGRVFELNVHGRLSEGMIRELGARRHDQGTTIIVNVKDRSALHGVISRVEDLGLDLISIVEVKSEETRGTEQ